MAKALKGIPENVTTLNLSWNHLNKLSTDGLVIALTGLPKSITMLDLRCNDLCELGADGLTTTLTRLPKNIAMLDLRCNDLYELGADGLGKILKNIPNNVTELDLSNNGLFILNAIDLAKALAQIPGHVKTVRLGDNGLFINRTYKQIDAFLENLGEQRHRFILSGHGESQLARALGPVAQLTQGNYPIDNSALPVLQRDVAAHILSFLETNQKPKNPIDFFRSQLKTTIERIECIQSNKRTQTEPDVSKIPSLK
ncbi:TPA: hypothetical protein I9781_002943 [Legionella pneumophila]|uniref:Leucine-rich repeat-containing protein n=2 Tax=Legionella pneumophila TaxID=446 RepID=A0AAN5T987_LEGPN|nr:hypothetical protein [Legionella pneumophila]TIH04598.1 hypothetical protein DI137_04490 [Legionella pneumophila]HAT3856307.1 hypothetical protein [Legionella pneumophila]HAT3859128.1 hypothetical protein [Legionella pneumophila]HAT3866003.1 hypothetical protein [Legionella pneumophila]HAT3868806.1 hypothetical protein [Legionella pneumophila]